MLLPPSGFCPAGWTAPAAINPDRQSKTEFAPKQMIKTGQFWILWLAYFVGCTAGLMMIMNITNIWQSMAGQGFPDTGKEIPESVFKSIINAGALAVMAVAILNSFGRIAWGFISDRAGRRKTLIAVFILCGTALLLLDNLAIYPQFLIGVCTIGFCFGGFLALYPAITADYFGTKNIGANYGLMFSAYGAGGLLGPWLAPKLITNVHKWSVSNATAANSFQTGSYADSFLITGLLCLFAAFFLSKLRNARKD
jgi:OFA family oxalate/formate antiporter-like MFS transporter